MKAPDKIFVQPMPEALRALNNSNESIYGVALEKDETYNGIPYLLKDAIIKTIMEERDRCVRPTARIPLTSLLEQINKL